MIHLLRPLRQCAAQALEVVMVEVMNVVALAPIAVGAANSAAAAVPKAAALAATVVALAVVVLELA